METYLFGDTLRGKDNILSSEQLFKDMSSVALKFHSSSKRCVVLFVAHPADMQQMRDNIPDWKPPENIKTFGDIPFMGVPVWQSPKIERGKIRDYRCWKDAYEELRFVLEAKDVAVLKQKMDNEIEFASALSAKG